jgi:hypothetical protein
MDNIYIINRFVHHPGELYQDFTEINTDPNSTPASFNADYFLTNAQNTYKELIGGYDGPVLFQSGWVQLLACTSTGGATYYSNMDKYVQSSNTLLTACME